MFRQQETQANGFAAKILLDQAIAARGFVTFVEKQVERLQHVAEPDRQLVANRNFKWNVRLADSLVRARQSFRDRRFAGEESARNFSDAEAAEHLERKRRLRFGRQQRMTTSKHQSQTAVPDFVLKHRRFTHDGLRWPLLHDRDDLRFLVVK